MGPTKFRRQSAKLDSGNPSREHFVAAAATVATALRHSTNALVAIVVQFDKDVTLSPSARAAVVAILAWALYRLATQSVSAWPTVVDYIFTIAVCLLTPELVSGPQFYLANSAPVAIAGTAVISFAVAQPAAVSLLMTAGIAAAFALGAARVSGWAEVPKMFNLYYFALQWTTSAAIRSMVLRVANAADEARNRRETAELNRQVLAAVREQDRERVRTLHDTVASTLLVASMSGSSEMPRIARQARRDLDVLWRPVPRCGHRDLVAAVREQTVYLSGRVLYRGLEELHLDESTVSTIVSIVREVLNNVERHARARSTTIEVGSQYVRISDDGRGFDPATVTYRHGIKQSVLGRMYEIGGSAEIRTAVGRGTTIELNWYGATKKPPRYQGSDPELLIERTRVVYNLALTAYGLVNLVVVSALSIAGATRGISQVFLALVAGSASAITSRGSVRWEAKRVPVVAAAAALLLVALLQPMSIPANQIGTQAQWGEAAVGWCLMPLVLRMRALAGAGALVGYWFAPTIIMLWRSPAWQTVVHIGYGTASILGVQLAAVAFNALIARAADAARRSSHERMTLLADQETQRALRSEFVRRHGAMTDRLHPLLLTLASSSDIDHVLRLRCRNEYQKLRRLFDDPAVFDHPLTARLRLLADEAEGRGITVALNIQPDLPELDLAAFAHLETVVHQAIDLAPTSVRITVTHSDREIEVSAFCTGATGNRAALEADSCDNSVCQTVVGDTVWLTLTCALKEVTPDYGIPATPVDSRR